MFFVKKIFGCLLSPGVIILVILGLGLLKLTLANKPKRSGWALIFLGIVCYYFFTTAFLPQTLLFPLKSKYKPLQQVQDIGKIDYIVVLSGDVRDNPQDPPTSQLGAATAFRVVEGIRLFHLFSEQPTLIMSGGDQPVAGEVMVAFARSLGVPAAKLLAETRSLDTYGNALGVKPIVKDAPFVLVTSASHLPRAMIIFQTLGMRPVPAPADINIYSRNTGNRFLPAGEFLEEMEKAIHEYLGLVYLKLFPRQAGR
jgi:uncharacterized SAM-binding protein YcdF (DUF218 family)